MRPPEYQSADTLFDQPRFRLDTQATALWVAWGEGMPDSRAIAHLRATEAGQAILSQADPESSTERRLFQFYSIFSLSARARGFEMPAPRNELFGMLYHPLDEVDEQGNLREPDLDESMAAWEDVLDEYDPAFLELLEKVDAHERHDIMELYWLVLSQRDADIIRNTVGELWTDSHPEDPLTDELLRLQQEQASGS